MIFRQALAVLFLALGLGACATYPNYGVRYEDGSYYSPADEGQGDYYYAPEPRYERYYYDDYDWFFGSPFYGPGHFGGWYGSPFYRYDGYCSVRYRYCPRSGYYDSFPRFGLSLQFGDPWYYDRYRRGYGDRWAPPPRRSRPPPAQPIGESPYQERDPRRNWAVPQDEDATRREFRRPPPEQLRQGGEAMADPEAEAPATRWRRAPSRSNPSSPPPRFQAPPPPPRASSSDRSDDEDAPRLRERRESDDGN
jgi:hypothetical protein